MKALCTFSLIFSVLSYGYGQLSEKTKQLVVDSLDRLVLFEPNDGILYREQLLSKASPADKRNWKKTIVPWTTLESDMIPEGNNLYLLVLQKFYFDAADKSDFFTKIDSILSILNDLEGMLKEEDRDQWISDAIIQLQKIQKYWRSLKENLKKYKGRDNRLLYSVRLLMANESTRLFKKQVLNEEKITSWICDNIEQQRNYRSITIKKYPDKSYEEESKVLFDTESWLLDFVNEKTCDVEANKELQKLLKLIYQKFHAFYFKNNAANDWWMLVAFYNDMVSQSTPVNKLDSLIKTLEYPDRLSDDEIAYYIMAICSEFTISYARSMGMDLVNLEHQSVIRMAEKRKILPLESIKKWRYMNYDRNQIAHGYDANFNHTLRSKLTNYLVFIKENKL